MDRCTFTTLVVNGFLPLGEKQAEKIAIHSEMVWVDGADGCRRGRFMVARETETGELRVDLMEQARDLPTPLPACTSFCETSEVLARYQHSCPVWRS